MPAPAPPGTAASPMYRGAAESVDASGAAPREAAAAGGAAVDGADAVVGIVAEAESVVAADMRVRLGDAAGCGGERPRAWLREGRN